MTTNDTRAFLIEIGPGEDQVAAINELTEFAWNLGNSYEVTVTAAEIEEAIVDRVALATACHDALVALRDGMLANDAYLNDDGKPGGSTAPDGDNYNELFDLVIDALRAADIPLTRGGSGA